MTFDVTNHYADDLDFRYSPQKPESPYGPPPKWLICGRCVEIVGGRELGAIRERAHETGCGSDCGQAWCECRCRR